jgi:hypothetical protein
MAGFWCGFVIGPSALINIGVNLDGKEIKISFDTNTDLAVAGKNLGWTDGAFIFSTPPKTTTPNRQ